jgi:hypothetical protein
MQLSLMHRGVAIRLFAVFSWLLATFALADFASGALVTWDRTAGDPGNWTDAVNWTGDVVPSSVTADEARIDNAGIAVINAAQGAVSTGAVTLGSNTGTSGTLRLTGGSLTTTNTDLRIGGNSNTTGGTGVLEQSGGDLILNAGNVNMGLGNAGAIGTYNMSGGLMRVNSATIVAVGNRGTGIVNQSAGTVYVRGASYTGTPPEGQVNLGRGAATANGSGSYTLSGGDLTVALLRYGQAVTTSGPASTNTFNLQGTGKLTVRDILIVNTAATNSFNFTGGTLTATNVLMPLTNNGGTLAPATLAFGIGANNQPIDPASVVTSPIGITTFSTSYTQSSGTLAVDVDVAASDLVRVTGIANLAGTVAVNELNTFDPALGSIFDVLTAQDIVGTLTPAGTTPSGRSYSVSIVPGGNGELLRLTVVPEPGTFSLLIAAAFGLLIWRRRAR